MSKRGWETLHPGVLGPTTPARSSGFSLQPQQLQTLQQQCAHGWTDPHGVGREQLGRSLAGLFLQLCHAVRQRGARLRSQVSFVMGQPQL